MLVDNYLSMAQTAQILLEKLVNLRASLLCCKERC